MQLTVKALIELLEKEDAESLVWMEGCDCHQEAWGIRVMEIRKTEPKTILIYNGETWG